MPEAAPRHLFTCMQVEATKFTEVGFHGRDVDQIIRDLVDAAIISTRVKMKRQLKQQISQAVEDKILDNLLGSDSPSSTRVSRFLSLFRIQSSAGILKERRAVVVFLCIWFWCLAAVIVSGF